MTGARPSHTPAYAELGRPAKARRARYRRCARNAPRFSVCSPASRLSGIQDQLRESYPRTLLHLKCNNSGKTRINSHENRTKQSLSLKAWVPWDTLRILSRGIWDRTGPDSARNTYFCGTKTGEVSLLESWPKATSRCQY
jgi:hypothetical protein